MYTKGSTQKERPYHLNRQNFGGVMHDVILRFIHDSDGGGKYRILY